MASQRVQGGLRAHARLAAVTGALLVSPVVLPPILPGHPLPCVVGCDATSSPSTSSRTAARADSTLPACRAPRSVRRSAPALPDAPRRWALGQNVALRNLRGREMCLWAQRAASSGATYLREDFTWSEIEPSRGRLDWRLQDEVVGTAARYGLTIVPLLLEPPRWAGGPLLPRDTAAFARFAARAAARYGPGGTFWRRHPSLPRRPATWFELFNEPYDAAKGYVPDPAAYAGVVAAAVPVARAANPWVRFLIEGETTYTLDGGRTQQDWIGAMYAAVPGFGRYFDALAAHPYARGSPLNWGPSRGDHRHQTRRVEEMRAALVAQGDGAKHIWITEIGWTTCGPRQDCVSESSQARFFGDLFRLQRTRWRDYVDAVFGFEFRDHPSRSSVQETSFGIVRSSGARKAGWFALRAARPR